jgi:hypothetical protein
MALAWIGSHLSTVCCYKKINDYKAQQSSSAGGTTTKSIVFI